MKKIICVICIVITAVYITTFAVPCFSAEGEYCYIVFELTSGVTIDSVNENKIVSVGTMNKLMTVLLTAEKINSGEFSFETELKTSEYANSMQGAQIWLMSGEEITVDELLKAVIIGNANDAAVVLAEAICGSEEKFVNEMNRKAEELGMKNTSFTNSCGYYDEQLSTATDMSKLVCELYKYDFLTEYFTTRLDYVRNGAAELVSTNDLIKSLDGIIGYKAGFDENNGYFAAVAAERYGKAFGTVILGGDDKDKLLSSASIKLNSAFSDYVVIKPKLPDDIPTQIEVKNSQKENMLIEVGEVRNIVIPKGAAESISAVTILPDYIYAPVTVGEKVGEVHFYRKDNFLFSVDIKASDNAEEKFLGESLLKLFKKMVSF